MIKLENNFKKYGSNFQLAILSLLIQDKSFSIKIKETLKPEYFDNKYSKWICETVVDYINQYKCNPRFEDIKVLIETKLPEASNTLYLAALNSIKEVDLSNKAFVETEVEKFCFTRYALQKLEEEKNHILLGDFELAKGTAYSIYKPIHTQGHEIDLKRDTEALMSAQAIHVPVPTMFPSVNAVSKGGPGGGDLVIVVAQSNLGKTNFLTAQARHAAVEGKNVLFVSLETKGEQILDKALAGLVGISIQQLRDHPEFVRKAVEKLPANIKFIEFKATQARVELIKQAIDDLAAQGFFPEQIMIDGLNQLKTPTGMKFSNSNDKFEYLAEELRDLARTLQVPIWSCFQSNRAGFNVKAADEANIGKAIEVYQVCDVMFMLTQTPQMYDDKQCYVTVLKNRLGPKSMMLLLEYDPALNRFVEIEVVDRAKFFDSEARATMNSGLDSMGKLLESKRRGQLA